MPSRPSLTLLAALAIGAAACSGGRGITPAELEELENAREIVHQGTTADGDEGLYKLSFTTTPSPPAKGDNTFTLTVKDAQGSAFDGADVLAQVFGIDGQDSGEIPTTSAKGQGVYEISHVVLDKSGAWLVKFHVTKGGTEESHDHAKFSVIIP